MIRKTISICVFICAIILGAGVGYVVTSASSFTYNSVLAYVSEIKTDVFMHREEGQGGPSATEIIESDFNETDSVPSEIFKIKKNKKLPRISALSYLVADLETGKVLASQNINQQLPIASVTKLMTALVADETLGLDTRTTITNAAINTYGTQGELKKGETYTISELLNPLLLESSNDAAEALAYTKNRPVFISEMNNKAKSLGLLNTSYEDASGLSPNNTSTVTDLFRLTQYISKYRNYILQITHEKKKEIGKKVWYSNSRFRSDPKYVGGKNGYTDEALKTQVAIFDEELGDKKRKVVYIVLRSTDVGYDIKMLRDYLRKNVEYIGS